MFRAILFNVVALSSRPPWWRRARPRRRSLRYSRSDRRQKDSSNWFCATRKTTISEAHRWEIVDAYCFEEPGQTRLQQTQQDERVTQLKAEKDDNSRARGELCSRHRQVVPPMTLHFNHRKGEWLASDKGFESRKRKIEIDPVPRTPTAHLASGDVVGIIVTETNPALFLANRGDAKEDNIDQIKSIEQLLALLGTSFAGITADLSKQRIEANARIDALTRPDQPDAWRALINRDTTSATAERITQLLREEAVDSEVFLTDLDRLRKWISAASTSHGPIKERLASLLEHRARLQLIAQDLESGPSTLKGSLDETLENPHGWRNLFATLGTDASALPSLQDCEAVFDAFVQVVVTEPDAPVDVHAAAIRFRQLFHSISGGTSGASEASALPCTSLSYVRRMEAAVNQVHDAARPAARNPADARLVTALREAQADSRERHLQHALILARFVRQLSALKQSMKETIGKEEETRKAALVLGLIASRVRDAAFRKRLDSDGLVVTNTIFVQEEVYSSKWTKVHTAPLRITLNSPIADAVPSERAKETTTSYRFTRRGFDKLTFGVGLVYTPAYSATYGVLDPDPSINQTQTTTTTTGGPPPAPVETTQVVRPELKQITEKDRQPRAGSYAVLVNYRLVGSSAAGLGGQFGVGMSADNPAFLGGVSINVSPYVTVGLGIGSFRLKRLSEEQADPEIRVATADEIKVDSKWQGTGYVSISVNLSGLPLFK